MQFNISNLHIGRPEQRLERFNIQIGQLNDEVESLAALSGASSVAGPYSLGGFGHGPRAEILCLESDLETCLREMLTHRAQTMSERAQGEPPNSADNP